VTVQQLIDALLGCLDSKKVHLDTPVVVKLGDRTYDAALADDTAELAVLPTTPRSPSGSKNATGAHHRA
jgi:hypothetical protein